MWASHASETRLSDPGCVAWRARPPAPPPPPPPPSSSAPEDEAACGSGGLARRILGGGGGGGCWWWWWLWWCEAEEEEEEPRSPTPPASGEGPAAIASRKWPRGGEVGDALRWPDLLSSRVVQQWSGSWRRGKKIIWAC